MADTLLECYWLLPDRSFQLAATPREPGPNVTRPPTNAPAVWRWRKATAAANRPRLSPRNAKKVNIIIRIHYGFMLVYHSWLPGYPSRSLPHSFFCCLLAMLWRRRVRGEEKTERRTFSSVVFEWCQDWIPLPCVRARRIDWVAAEKKGEKKRIDGWKDGRDREWRTRRRKKKPSVDTI